MDRQTSEIVALNKRLMAVVNGFRPSVLLLAANRQGVFEIVAKGPATADQIARVKDWDVRATNLFLNALTALDFLRKTGGKFTNSEITEKLLLKNSPYYQGDILKHNQNLLEHRWIRVEEVLKSGKPIGAPIPQQGAERLHNFIAGMANSANLTAGLLWERIDLSTKKRLLDVGGGPGSYAIDACKLFPQLSAVVFDLPEVESIFLEFVAESGLSQRVNYHAGDYLREPLPKGFDVALLSNIIHSLGEEDNLLVFGKISDALESDGTLLVKDFFVSEDGTQPPYAALFAVNMLIGTESGATFSRNTVESWLNRAHFEVTDYFDLTEQTGVLTARKR